MIIGFLGGKGGGDIINREYYLLTRFEGYNFSHLRKTVNSLVRDSGKMHFAKEP